MSDRILFSLLGGLAVFGGLWVLEPEATTVTPSGSIAPLTKAQSRARSLATLAILPAERTAASDDTKETSDKKPTPEALESELAYLKTLTDQIFPPEDNKRTQRELYQKSELVMSASLYLRELTKFEENSVLKNEAIDFLLAAAKEGNKLADEEIKDIVLDARVEDESISRFERENLAGIQAELLYGWSAESQGRLSEIEPQLPGPISRKIWMNVKNTQDNNHSESLAEASLTK